MAKMFSNTKDHVLIGFAVGLVSPAVLAAFAWYIMEHTVAFKKADLLLIGCVAVNLVWLKYFTALHKDNIGRGILSATFLCAFAFFFYKVMQEI